MAGRMNIASTPALAALTALRHVYLTNGTEVLGTIKRAGPVLLSNVSVKYPLYYTMAWPSSDDCWNVGIYKM